MTMKPHRIEATDDDVAAVAENRTLAYVHVASQESVEHVLAQPPHDADGRSGWVWLRLPNGDLILGVFPRGDTYFNVEGDAEWSGHSLTTCAHCRRSIVKEGGVWIDPDATGDDSVWRETCDAHDTFVADHEPTGVTASTSAPHYFRCMDCGHRFDYPTPSLSNKIKCPECGAYKATGVTA